MPQPAVIAWQPLLRPPLPGEAPSVDLAAYDVPLKALACRNQFTSVIALVTSDEPLEGARLAFSDLASDSDTIPASAIHARQIGAVPTPEAGLVPDVLYEGDGFDIDRSAAMHVSIAVPKGIRAGIYRGSVSLVVGGSEAGRNRVELEVADVDLPDAHDWHFLLGVWMNPATIARWHGVETWSEEHFALLRPYIEDLAAHGQKTAVVPICFQPWGTQTRDPYPNAVIWRRRGGQYEFDFSIFDRYVKLHEKCGISRAIHCYSIVQGPGATDASLIVFTDVDSGQEVRIPTTVGDADYVKAWSAFLEAFRNHLAGRGWLHKTHLGFDEKPDEVMGRILAFLEQYAPQFKIALAGNIGDELIRRFDDLCLHIPFDQRGVARMAPPERMAMGVAELLDSSAAGDPRQKTTTTFYVCCGPPFPNTFIHSPLVESRLLPMLAFQGGYDGFLRWSYNDWSDDPFAHPEWGSWPTGDTFFVYPGPRGPLSSLRWEQLREGICDYELAMIASANIRTPEEMVDYEHAVSLACRNVDGRTKSLGDIELARRLLIPIAQHGNEE